MVKQGSRAAGNETYYLFGDNFNDEWAPLLAEHRRPPFAEGAVSLSFGVGGKYSGVPFHIHGPGYSEVLHGRKRWYLYPAPVKPRFDPDRSQQHWVTHTYPTLSESDKPLECVLKPGQLLYFPPNWYHAVLNLDPYTAFISSFTTEEAA